MEILGQPIFHIGYHKTGSSFLQSKVFGDFDFFYRVPRCSIRREFINPGPFHFDKLEAKKFVYKQQVDNKISIFSNERLSGEPHYGGRDAKEIAERIHQAVPKAKILVIIREQLSVIQSSYAQYCKACGSLSLNEYINPTSKRDLHRFRKEHFEYHHLLKFYNELFGPKNVLCVPYEVLKMDHEIFVRDILLFTGLNNKQVNKIIGLIDSKRINQQMNILQIQIKRYFNPFISYDQIEIGNTFNIIGAKFFFSILNKIAGILVTDKWNAQKKRAQMEYLKLSFGDYFQSSNRKLQNNVNYDLQALGYNI